MAQKSLAAKEFVEQLTSLKLSSHPSSDPSNEKNNSNSDDGGNDEVKDEDEETNNAERNVFVHLMKERIPKRNIVIEGNFDMQECYHHLLSPSASEWIPSAWCFPTKEMTQVLSFQEVEPLNRYELWLPSGSLTNSTTFFKNMLLHWQQAFYACVESLFERKDAFHSFYLIPFSNLTTTQTTSKQESGEGRLDHPSTAKLSPLERITVGFFAGEEESEKQEMKCVIVGCNKKLIKALHDMGANPLLVGEQQLHGSSVSERIKSTQRMSSRGHLEENVKGDVVMVVGCLEVKLAADVLAEMYMHHFTHEKSHRPSHLFVLPQIVAPAPFQCGVKQLMHITQVDLRTTTTEPSSSNNNNSNNAVHHRITLDGYFFTPALETFLCRLCDFAKGSTALEHSNNNNNNNNSNKLPVPDNKRIKLMSTSNNSNSNGNNTSAATALQPLSTAPWQLQKPPLRAYQAPITITSVKAATFQDTTTTTTTTTATTATMEPVEQRSRLLTIFLTFQDVESMTPLLLEGKVMKEKEIVRSRFQTHQLMWRNNIDVDTDSDNNAVASVWSQCTAHFKHRLVAKLLSVGHLFQQHQQQQLFSSSSSSNNNNNNKQKRTTTPLTPNVATETTTATATTTATTTTSIRA